MRRYEKFEGASNSRKDLINSFGIDIVVQLERIFPKLTTREMIGVDEYSASLRVQHPKGYFCKIVANYYAPKNVSGALELDNYEIVYLV